MMSFSRFFTLVRMNFNVYSMLIFRDPFESIIISFDIALENVKLSYIFSLIEVCFLAILFSLSALFSIPTATHPL